MKTLIRPTFVFSFLLVLTGLIPDVPVYMPIIGGCILWWVSYLGWMVHQYEDRDFNSQIEQMRMAVLDAKTAGSNAERRCADLLKTVTEEANRASKAVSEIRNERSALR